MRCAPKIALSDLIANLGGIPAHEGYVRLVGDDAVGIQKSGNHREANGQPFLDRLLGRSVLISNLPSLFH
jgi:hypothetical protein